MRKVITSHDCPPIPVRSMDWSATFDDYDAEVVDGQWTSSHPVGHGRTEAEAIADLLEQAS